MAQQTTVSVPDVVDRYLGAWNEPDDDRRVRLIEEVWTADGSLTDPPLAGTGREGIAAMARALHQHYPGHAFRRSSEIDAHHNVLRFAWELVAADGAVALTGLDVGEFDDDGRLVRIAGFFGELPARSGGER